MPTNYNFKIFETTKNLPEKWNDLASKNILLSTTYFQVLEQSKPNNISLFFIGIFDNEKLIGISLSMLINLNLLSSFGDRDKCLKTFFRNLIFKNFSSHVLVIGNNFFTGQNAFVLDEKCNKTEAVSTLKNAANELILLLKSKKEKVHITTFKDFEKTDLNLFEKENFKEFVTFSTQPNMIFSIVENWKREEHYVADLSKKYRDQYKRSHKKIEGIDKKKMTLIDIEKHQKTIYNLYFYVAKNAPFNTFFLAENHFAKLKEILQEKFLFYGYFLDEKLIGFNTLIKNGNTMETYFLGYDETMQREKMLYLNMLYDMVGYSIKKEFKQIIFARTALEIKSSVGAKPIKMYGFMQHQNKFINRFMKQFINYFEPETIWQERNPFK